MTLTAALLLITSAFTHAGWNLLGKKSKSAVSGFFLASMSGLLILLPILPFIHGFLPGFDLTVGGLVLITGLCQAIYYTGLSGAYSHGDMAIAYPLARSLPVLFVTAISILTGSGDRISLQAYFGIIMIVAGGIILPLNHFRDFSLQRYVNKSTLFALLAAAGTTGYSIIDDRALSILRGNLPKAIPSWQGTIGYAFMEGTASFLWMGVILLLRRGGITELKQTLKAGIRPSLLMGMGIYLTYTLVLVSLAFVSDVSYVVAFRQASIPIGVILSVVLLKEKGCPARFVGVTLIFIGLVLLGTG